MKNKLRQMSAITMFALASFTMTSVVQPTSANAVCGVFFWPLLIVGAVVEVVGVVSLADPSGPSIISLLGIYGGIVLLKDDGSFTGNFVSLDQNQANELGLSHEEHHAYNNRLHQMKHVFETVWAKVQESGGTTTADVRTAYLEVTESLDLETKTAFQALTKILTSRYTRMI